MPFQSMRCPIKLWGFWWRILLLLPPLPGGGGAATSHGRACLVTPRILGCPVLLSTSPLACTAPKATIRLVPAVPLYRFATGYNTGSLILMCQPMDAVRALDEWSAMCISWHFMRRMLLACVLVTVALFLTFLYMLQVAVHVSAGFDAATPANGLFSSLQLVTCVYAASNPDQRRPRPARLAI